MTPLPASAPSPTSTLLPSLRAKWDCVAAELGKFLAVGGVAFIVDMAVFNLLRQPGSSSVPAKAASTVIATLVAYLGNRYWSFRHRAGEQISNETAVFFALNGIGLVISLACVGVSHHLLGLTSGAADNAAALAGIALGTLFRFWSYRKFVFTNTEDAQAEITLPDAIPGTVIGSTATLAGVTALPHLAAAGAELTPQEAVA